MFQISIYHKINRARSGIFFGEGEGGEGNYIPQKVIKAIKFMRNSWKSAKNESPNESQSFFYALNKLAHKINQQELPLEDKFDHSTKQELIVETYFL